MNKKYMDFVPANRRVASAKKNANSAKPVAMRKMTTMSHPRSKATTKEMALGVVEDFGEKNPSVKKNSLSENDLAKEAKAKKVGLKAEKKRVGLVGLETKKVDETFRTPKPQFINQDKVVKRPLSKNVYPKKAVANPEEKPKGPVTIISKSEKHSHISLVVMIILTVILGAAAGTIAFLLLPK